MPPIHRRLVPSIREDGMERTFLSWSLVGERKGRRDHPRQRVYFSKIRDNPVPKKYADEFVPYSRVMHRLLFVENNSNLVMYKLIPIIRKITASCIIGV